MTIHKRGELHQIVSQTPAIGQLWVGPNPQLDLAKLYGADPVTKQGEAIKDLAAAIRELADVLYHINTED